MQNGNNTARLTLEGRIRQDILTAGANVKREGAHFGPSLSIVEICAAILKNYDLSRDVFVLSKAHGALGYYAAMHQFGIITDEQFQSFDENGGGGSWPAKPLGGKSY